MAAAGRLCLCLSILLIALRYKQSKTSLYSSTDAFPSLWRYCWAIYTIRHDFSSVGNKFRHRSTRHFIRSNGGPVIGLLLLCGDVATHPGPTTSSRSIGCMVINAQSLKSLNKIKNPAGETIDIANNLHRFQDLVYSEDPDIVCVNETWFNETITNEEVLHSGYTIYRKERTETTDGFCCSIKEEKQNTVWAGSKRPLHNRR